MWNAISEESTSWYDPSYTVACTPSTGNPAMIPDCAASSIPSPTAGIYSLGMLPPTTVDSNLNCSSPFGSIGSNLTLQ